MLLVSIPNLGYDISYTVLSLIVGRVVSLKMHPCFRFFVDARAYLKLCTFLQVVVLFGPSCPFIIEWKYTRRYCFLLTIYFCWVTYIFRCNDSYCWAVVCFCKLYCLSLHIAVVITLLLPTLSAYEVISTVYCESRCTHVLLLFILSYLILSLSICSFSVVLVYCLLTVSFVFCF